MYRFTQFPPNEAEILERTRITNQIQRIGNGTSNGSSFNGINSMSFQAGSPSLQAGSKRSRTPDAPKSPNNLGLQNLVNLGSMNNLSNFNNLTNLSQLTSNLNNLTKNDENGIQLPSNNSKLDIETVQTLLNPNVISTYANLLATLAPQLKNLASDNTLKTVYDKLTQELVAKPDDTKNETKNLSKENNDSEPEQKKQKLEIEDDEDEQTKSDSKNLESKSSGNSHFTNFQEQLSKMRKDRKIVPCFSFMYCDEEDEEENSVSEEPDTSVDLNTLKWKVSDSESASSTLAKVVGEKLSQSQMNHLLKYFK